MRIQINEGLNRSWEMKSFGRRKEDCFLAIDWNGHRAIRKVRLKDDITSSHEYEPVIYDDRGGCKAMGLLSRGWRDWFYGNERENFTHDEYFVLADKLFAKKGVNPYANWNDDKRPVG
jgi:hypothetical protein